MNRLCIKIGVAFAVLLVSSLPITSVFGQATVQNWTLEQCLQHALSNNLSLKSSALDISQSEVTQKQASKDYLPSVNAGASHGYNWGQRIDPFTNEFASERVRTNSMYVSGNWMLFNGLQNYYLVQKAKTQSQFQVYNQEVLIRNLKIDVTAHYLQVLLGHRQLLNAQKQIALTHKIQNRTKELVQAEQATEFALLEIESQIALDSLAVTQAANNLRLSEFRLKQFLNLPPDTDFKITTEASANNESLSLTPIQMEELPELKQADEQAKLNATNLKIAQRKLSPTLSLNASLGTGYSGNNTELIGSEFVAKSFNTQLDENFYQSAAITLSVPIFNKGSVASEIKLSRIEMEKAALQKKTTLLDLQNKIAQLKLEVENAGVQQSTSQIALNATQKALDIAKLRYDEGNINFADFLEVRNKHFIAQSQFANAQFEYLFKLKILNYYSK